jgi:hypothetical protein
MKNESNKVTDISPLSAKAEHPLLNGHIQESLNKAEGKVAAHDTLRPVDVGFNYREHSVFQCIPLQGQACFRCLCLFGHPIENSRACANNHLRCQAGIVTPELSA